MLCVQTKSKNGVLMPELMCSLSCLIRIHFFRLIALSCAAFKIVRCLCIVKIGFCHWDIEIHRLYVSHPHGKSRTTCSFSHLPHPRTSKVEHSSCSGLQSSTPNASCEMLWKVTAKALLSTLTFCVYIGYTAVFQLCVVDCISKQTAFLSDQDRKEVVQHACGAITACGVALTFYLRGLGIHFFPRRPRKLSN